MAWSKNRVYIGSPFTLDGQKYRRYSDRVYKVTRKGVFLRIDDAATLQKIYSHLLSSK